MHHTETCVTSYAPRQQQRQLTITSVLLLTTLLTMLLTTLLTMLLTMLLLDRSHHPHHCSASMTSVLVCRHVSCCRGVVKWPLACSTLPHSMYDISTYLFISLAPLLLRVRLSYHSIDIAAEQAALVWACAAKR